MALNPFANAASGRERYRTTVFQSAWECGIPHRTLTKSRRRDAKIASGGLDFGEEGVAHDDEHDGRTSTRQVTNDPFSMDGDRDLSPPMADWRENLRRLLKERGMNMKTASEKAGLDASMVYKILKKPNADPQISTVRGLAKALNVSIDELMYGVVPSADPVKLTPVVGDVAAGAWMDTDLWDEAKYEPVPAMPSRYPSLAQKAWHVVGNSVDLLGIADDSFIVTVEYWKVRNAPTDGDVVVVEERDGSLIRRTCKEVLVRPGEYELRPRSSDARHKPIVVPAGNKSGDHGVEIEIVGLVIGTYRRIGR